LARRRHSPDCIPHWANTLWISDNKTATITDTDAFAGRRPSAVLGLLSFKQRDRDGVSLRGTRGERHRLTREGRINPSGEGPRVSRGNPSRRMAGALSKYCWRSDRAAHCGPLSVDFFPKARRFPAAIFRGLSYERPPVRRTQLLLWSAVILVSPHCAAEGVWPSLCEGFISCAREYSLRTRDLVSKE